MNVRFVHSFVATADLGSFSKAAEALFSTQATVASRVAKLEEELGVPLFRRDGSSLRLTEEGHTALAVARELLDAANRFVTAASTGRTAEGVLRIAWTDYVSHLMSSDFLRHAARTHPRLDFELLTGSSMDVIHMLQEGRIDLGVSVGGEPKRNMRCRHLFDLQMQWIASPDLFDGTPPEGVDALAGQPLISYPRNTLPAQEIERQFEKSGVSPSRTFWLYNVSAVIRSVEGGLGIALLPRVLVAEHLRTGRLLALDALPAVAELSFYAQFRADSRSQLCDEMCDTIIAFAKGRALS